MRSRPLLLGAAATLAAVHAVGVLFASPILRYAEILALLLLLAYAALTGLPSPRWVLPAAIAVLLTDAVRTLPAVPVAGSGLQFRTPAQADLPSGFEVGLGATWAALIFVVLMPTAARGTTRRRRAAVPAAVAAVLVTGYAVVRVGGIYSGTRAADSGSVATAAGLAVLMPLALSLAAAGVAAVLAARGHRRAAAGAVVLAAAALLHLDAALGAVPLPYPVYASQRTAMSVLTSPPSLPGAVAASAAIAEFTAYLLLVTGLSGRRTAPSDGGAGSLPSG